MSLHTHSPPTDGLSVTGASVGALVGATVSGGGVTVCGFLVDDVVDALAFVDDVVGS